MTPQPRVISSLAVSGLPCSGKTTLSKELATSLNWAHVNSGERFRELASAVGLRIKDFGSLDDTVLKRVDEEIQTKIRKTSNCVWEGRLTIWLAREIKSVFKIYCLATRQARASRCASREGLTVEKARELIAEREHEESAVFWRLYGIKNVRNESSPDLIIDTTRNSAEACVDLVLVALRKGAVV